VFNKLEGAYFKRYTTNSGALSSPTGDMLKTDHVLQPVPINIEMNMSILAKYQSDVDQIISNFIPYNDPYIVISWKLPDDIATINQEIRSEVLWSGSISLNYPTEIDPGTSYRVGADTSFTVKGWLFKKPLATHPVNNIYTINTSYTPTVDLIDLSFNDQTEKETIITTVSAVPSITYIDPSPAYVGYPTDISLFGYMFETVSQIVVSGSPDMFVDNISAFNFNSSADTSLSSLYPEYSGVEVTYDITNDNYLIFTLPAIQTAGNINVIISNQAGYTTTILPVSASDLS